MDKRKVLIGAAIVGLVSAGVVSHSTPALAKGHSKKAKADSHESEDHHDAKKDDGCNTPSSCKGEKATCHQDTKPKAESDK